VLQRARSVPLHAISEFNDMGQQANARTSVRLALGAVGLLANIAAANDATPAQLERQSLEDAWWTGPIVAAGAGTLPQGYALIEPYVYDVITRGRYDEDGNYRSTDTVHSLGSLTYMLYGVTDGFTAGVIPTFGFNDVDSGPDSSGLRVGDVTLQGQWRLSQFREGSWLPTTSLVLQETLPTGKHDRLGMRSSDGLGAGAYTTTLAVHSQYYFWLPTGRILRMRFNVSYALPDTVDVADRSVYGTREGFRGRARPGNTFMINSAWEYSMTRNWVLALDLIYQHDDNTRVRGQDLTTVNGQPQRLPFAADSGTSWKLGLAPAIEYNWTSRIGVIVGARWFAAGRNTGASVTPVAAINMVY
jgi:hypothetical protein